MARPLAALGHRCQPLLTSSGLIDAAAESCQAHRVAVAASATPIPSRLQGAASLSRISGRVKHGVAGLPQLAAVLLVGYRSLGKISGNNEWP
ncbi:hypothetical protein PF004_g3112 [Phytophthora fragariae]|uniref:Uncharacterized protein n=1 Tax=Phytophthora fragariae TaxID=53985 RepID=A0A6G0PMT5_9STRA|nr:hypothetical protein PF004_g3112 [Phytophthora fragariae]KAE9354482.1 hypothetical protein PF008_g4521 [Phytophthora fragariae]